jgi:hypothetical protein
MPDNEGNIQEDTEVRLQRFILFAKEGWPQESELRAFLEAHGFSIDVARDEDSLEQHIRRLGEDSAYLVVHERSLLIDSRVSVPDNVRGFTHRYYQARQAKPGRRTWLILVKMDPSETEGSYVFDCGDCVDIEVTEPLDMREFMKWISLLERRRDNPDLYPRGWDE